MKSTDKILIWMVAVIFSCSFTLGLYQQGAGVSEIPHANVKVVIPSGWTAETTIKQAERAVLSLGYVRQPNDWQEWTSVLNGTDLENKKRERSYKKGDITISYYPESDYPYKLHVIWIQFDEWKGSIFSERGVMEYQSFAKALASIGLEPAAEDEVDHKFARPLITPTMYNDKHPRPEGERLKQISFGFGLLSCYGVIVLWPGFWVISNLVNRFSISSDLKRIIFAIGGGLFLAPAPIPLPLLGPLPLVPLLFTVPFAFENVLFLKLLAVSVGCTAMFSLIVSLFLWRARSVST